MSPEITLITKRDANPLMSKRIFLTEQGEVCSEGSQCLMVQGAATRATAETASELAEHIVSCRSDPAMALGALKTELPDLVASRPDPRAAGGRSTHRSAPRALSSTSRCGRGCNP